MKFDQLVIALLVALVVIALGKIIAEAFDEIEISYDPLTGCQNFAAWKRRALKSASPLTLEG